LNLGHFQTGFIGIISFPTRYSLTDPAVMVGKLHVDTVRREIDFFVGANTGVRFPNHRHAGIEEIVVLEGDLVIDGELYSSGECIRSVSGSAHQPETYGGCLIFLRTSLDNKVIA